MTMVRNEPRLSDDERRLVLGMVHELATPAWQDPRHRFAWERERAAQKRVNEAISRVRAGGRSVVGEPRDAAPRWFEPMVRRMLEESSTTYHSGSRFVWVRRLERIGLVEVEHDDTWVLAALGGLGVQYQASQVVDYLSSDPALRDELVWRLFEVEGGGEISLANVDRFGPEPWRGAFLALVADGTLPRDRVLDSCLQALARDFNRYRAKWFSGLWAAMEPTPEERASRQALLLPPLRSSAPPVVTFAVKELARIHDRGGLDALATVAALGPAVQAGAKGTALQALRLAAALAEQDPAADVLPLARGALEHPHPEVQAAAATLLASAGAGDLVEVASETLSPSVRSALGLTAGAAPASAPVPVVVEFTPPPAVTVPTDDSEVVELAAALLEQAPDAYAVEALLGALATGRGRDSLGALAKRARSVGRASSDNGGGPAGVSGQVAGLVLASVGEPAPDPPAWTSRTTPAMLHLRRRFSEVADVLAGRREPGALMATPDLPGGLVSPSAVLERLGDRLDVPPDDATAALLRLGPGAERDRVIVRLAGQTDAATVLTAGDPLAGPASRTRIQTWRVRFGEGSGPECGLASPDTWSGPTSLEGPVAGPDLGDWLGLVALILPADAEHFAALAHRLPFLGTRYPGPWHDTVRTMDLLAAHPGRHGELSATVVVFGLDAARAEQRLSAVDALVDLLTTTRLTSALVADALARHHEVLTPTRWADALARTGAATGPAVPIDVLTGVLPRLPRDLRGLHAPLQVLLEESLRASRPISDPGLRAWLDGFSGSSKTARTARRLLG